MQAVDSDTYLQALLSAPRPGADKFLAFYDHRVGCIGTDPRLLLLPLDDHICHRGDGLFESICYRERKIFVLDEHLARMRDGAQALDITPPCSWEEMRARILDVARASGRAHGDLRVFLSRGPGGFGVSPQECPQAGLYIVALASRLPSEELYRKGLTAFSSAIPPKQEYLARIKNTNYLPNVFMAVEARQKGMDVAVTFDESFARATGTKAGLYNLLIAVVVAVIIVLAMNLVGSLLISALVIFPALSAMRMFKSFRSVTICAAVLSVFCALLGILASILAGTPVGSTIVAVQIGAFGLSWLAGTVFGGVRR